MRTWMVLLTVSVSVLAAGAWAVAPAPSGEVLDESLLRARNEARLREVFQGLLASEQQRTASARR